MKNYRILFMGTAPFAVPSLKKIVSSNNHLVGVYTSPAKKANRGMKFSISPVAEFAEAKNIEISSPPSISSSEELKKLQEMNLDMIIVVAYGLILPEEVINLPKLGCFNVHASLLPRWRGAAPIQRAMIEGDQTTGVTIMKMDKGLDTGDIGLQKEIKIEQQNYSELEKELANEGAELLINFIDRLDGSIQFTKQNDTQACYAKKIQKQEALIDWTENAEKINRRINAYNPSPCAWFSLNNKRIKILKAEVIHEKGEAGKIMIKEFLIGCGINSIRPLLLRVEGKQDCTINDFLLGHKIEVGSYIQ